MAILYVVCVKDSALDAYERPFFVPAIGLAVRHFGDEVGNSDSPISKHPSDYFLYDLGVFDTDSGEFSCPHGPKLLARGADYVHKAYPDDHHLA